MSEKDRHPMPDEREFLHMMSDKYIVTHVEIKRNGSAFNVGLELHPMKENFDELSGSDFMDALHSQREYKR